MQATRKVNRKMVIRSFAAAIAAAGVALAVVGTSLGGGSSSSNATALRGTVGPGFTIKLTKAGKVVKSLRAGTYKLTVSDRSAGHNYELERQGGKGREITSVPFVGTKTVTVRLTRGVWKVYCDPHASVMVARFAVGGASLANARATTTTDDRGGHGEPEPGDDHGGHGEPEPGDDHGGR
jgi:plastocyanin